MRQVFVRELSAYDIDEFARCLDVDSTRAFACVEALITRGVLRLLSGNSREEYDAGYPSRLKGKYQFVYVGLTIFEDLVIIVYPKYMDTARFAGNAPSRETQDELQCIFRVLRKNAGSYSDIASLSEGSRMFNDRIALMLMLMEMYDEYGVYSNYVRTLKRNGTGDISWERTIAMHEAFVSDGAPIYFDYEAIANTRDDADFIMRLHRCALTECSSFMKESGLGQILALDEIELSDEKLDDIGDRDYILCRLDSERGVQFVTWKQEVLDLLERYVAEEKSIVHSDEVVCLGSTSFYSIWEKACKVAFGDLLDKRLNKIGVPLAGEWANYCSDTLLEIVPGPQWTRLVDGESKPCGEVATFVPDTVAIWDLTDGGRVFVILDAKYYTPKMGESPYGMPGVESVVKQILYQRAYREFVLAHGFERVVNSFLIPSDGGFFQLVGHVDFPGVFDSVDLPFMNGVDMWMLPADRIWHCYLAGKTLTNGEMRLLLTGE